MTDSSVVSAPYTIPPVNVGTSVKVTITPFTFSSVTHQFTGNMTVLNTSRSAITAPVSVALTSLSPGFTLLDATGTYNGSPDIRITSAAMNPGASITVTLQFSVGATAIIKFTPVTYSGL
jgi:hypothetical protein